MKKITFLFTLIFAFSWLGNAQVLVSEDFDSGTPAGWTDSYANTDIAACSGNSERDNLWTSSPSGDLTTTNYVAASNGTDLTVSFDYKIVEYDFSNPIVPQGSGWGTAELQYSTDDGANWNTFFTLDDSNHTASANCANVSAVVPAADLPDGADVKLRILNTWASGDYYFYVDNFEANQVINCTLPSVSTTIVDDCANAEYSIEIDVTDLGDATTLTLNNDIGLPSQSITSTGLVTFGPVSSGQPVILDLVHDSDSDCDLDLGSFTFTCPPVNDNCEGALPITVTTDNTTFTSFSTDFATGSVLEQVSCDDIGTNLGVWYTFTAPASQLEFLQGSDGDPGIAIFEGPDCNNLTEITTGCANNDDGTITGLTVGNDYYAMVFTDSSQDLADFVLYFINCPSPTGLTADNVTADSADLTWTAGDVETEWEVLWGPTGFDPATEGTLINDDDGTLGVSLSGLSENTTYDFYVSSVCSASSSSVLEGPLTFTTACNAFLAPFSEDFSSLALPNCWSQGVANQKDWEFDDDTSGTNIGDDGTVNSSSASGGGFAWLDDSSPHELDTRLESPFIDVSGLSVPALSFYYISNNQGDLNVDFKVEVWDGSAWNEVFFSNQNTPNGEWTQVIVDISTLTFTGNIKLAFVIDENSGTDFNDDIAIDDVAVEEAPSCLVPTGLTASNIGLDSADISWSSVSTATDGYIWSLYLSGADPDVDTPENSGTTAAGVETVNLTGLVEATDYDFYVESDCGANGTSGLSAALTFSTITPGQDCSAAITATVAPAGDTTQPVIFDTTDLSDMSSVPSCEGFDSTEQGFWYEFTTNATDGVALNLLSGDAGVLEGAVYDACGGTELLCFADGGSIDFSSEVLVTGLMPNTTYILQFYTESFDEGAYEVAITDLPACTQPVNLAATGVTSDGVTLNWDDVVNAVNGFQWSVYTSPSDPAVDTAVASGSVAAGVTTADVTGLMPASDYDFYVLSDCGAADGISSLAGPSEFTTACAPFALNFTEDFTGLTTNVNTSLNCWEEGSGIFTPVGSGGWGGQTFNNDSSNDNGNGQALYINLYSSTPTNAFVTTPIIDLGAGDPGYVLNYDAFVKPWTGTDQVTDMGPHSVSVVISTDGGATWDLAANTLTTYDTSNIPNDLSNTLESISLGAYSGQVKIGFLSDEDGTATDLRFYIDNLYVGPPPPPVNDNLCDAIPLTVGAPTSADAYSNVNATAEPNEPVANCFQDGINGSVWFSFVAPASGDVTVTTDIAGSTSDDTEIAVYAAPADCTDLSTLGAELGCDNDSGTVVGFNSILDLPGLTAGETYFIQVDIWSFAGNTDLAFGEFGIRVLDNNPPCPEPTNLNASGITADSATLNWDDVVEATLGYSWSVYASPSDPAVDTPVASGTTGVGGNTASVTGLMAETDYDFYVTSDCDASGLSILSGPSTFTTDCGPAGLNYEEDFTNLDFDLNNNFDCWNEGTGLFAVSEASGWGPQIFNNDATNDNGNGQALYINLYNFGGQVNNWATTQSIDLGAGDPNYVLSYDAFVKPWTGTDLVTDMGLHSVSVVISTDGGATWDLASNTLTTYDNNNIPNELSNTLETISLAGYSGVVKIGFLSDEDGTATDLRFYVDNVFVGIPPVCNEPTIPNVTNVSFDSAELNWTGVPEATNGYAWSVYTSPSDPGTDTPVFSGTVAAGVESVPVSGLTPETDYDFYVSSDCDVDGTSDLAGPITFTTGCAPFIPDYSEDFTTFVPNCWNVATDGDPTTGPTGLGSGDWVSDGFLNDPTQASARLNLFNTGTSDWLLSPTFDLSAGGYEVVFDIGSAEWAGTGFESFGSDDVVQFLYSDDNGATWNVLITWAQGSEPSNSGELSVTDLSAITGSSVQFAFWGTEGTVDDPEDVEIYVDNFEVRTPPSCPEPLNLAVSNITIDSADFSWDDNVEATNGYNWSVYTSPSDPSVDTAVASGTTAAGMAMVQVTGLMSGTDYDFYLEADCDTNGTSVLVGPFAFSTNPDFCAGDLFYDNGGPTGDYALNSNETITISPSNAGDVVTVEFLSFSTELSFDGLQIYDGPDTSAPLLDSGFTNPGFGPLIDGTWTGEPTDSSSADGVTFISTHPTGALTFVFTSDGSVVDSGWEAVVTCGPPPAPASVQVIHNSADPAAQFVDVYVNGTLTLDDFEFRTATPFVDLPAGVPVSIDVAPSTSADATESIYNLTTTLVSGESYIVVANGVLDPTQFDSSVNSPIAFNLDVFAGAQQASTNPGENSVLVHHGASDAPTVDVVETSVPLGTVADDISYSQFQGYVDVPNDDYIINVELADNSAVVASYEANLASFVGGNLSDLAVTVVASGFLDPSVNQNGASFGLWAALPIGGPLEELPLVEPAPMSPAPDPTEDPANVISMYSGVYTDVPVDTWLTPWSPPATVLEDIQIQGNDTKKYSNLDFAGIETVSNPIDASGMDFFHMDVWSPNATTFRVKLVDLGAGVEGELAFNIAQEQWVSLEIPLADFADPALVTNPANLLTSTSSIQQLIISGLPAGAVTAYVDNVYFSDDPNVSTVAFDKDNFSFYPNPTSGVLNIQSSNQIEEIKVFSVLGQEVLSLTPNTVSPSISVDALQAGTYLMNVTIDGVTKNFKFIKE
jgi:hypothetical protein